MSTKKYKEEDMTSAISAVKQNRLNIRKAAAEYHVPKSTLNDRIRGRFKTTVQGPERQITAEEETGLVQYLLYMANQGFPLTRQMTRAYIQAIVKRSGRKTLFNLNKGPSNKWIKKFIQRHPDLSERKPENQDKARSAMSNKKVMADFFTLLDTILLKYGVKDKPSQIFNCDETGFSGRETGRSKVIGPKRGHVFRRRVTTADHITAHLCVSADGRFLPTMIIYQGSLPHRKYNDSIPDSWGFATSENGYMDTQLFQRWFTKMFIPHCGRERPVVLLMDNCDAHISGDVVEAAIANDIVLVGLPGHTTHILQPLDVKIIGPLKSRFAEMTVKLGFGGAGVTIGKAKFPIVMKHAIDSATPVSIQDAFAVTGICPYNPSAIDTSQLVEASFDPPCEERGEQVQTCERCGHFLTNPLVQRGLIPPSLADILLPPPVKPADTQRKKRVVAEGRLISGEEMLKQLKEKEQIEKKKIDEMEKRKKDREIKKEKRLIEEEERRIKRKKREEERELKLKEKKRKADERQEKKKGKCADVHATAVLIANSYVCDVCGMHGGVDDEVNGIFWFGCDEELCGRWYHEGCLTENERMYVQESLEEGGSDWFCKRCKPWLYEEE
ncbi:uncharacterized protein LOC123532137 [Mercenaria mercenaria]|uniref:uncharacterized protein LOC123532137 n=1 Tax=Mercenaria mercenaria TaxID=6596 RepID=UPI00234E5A20|nr:uncharacterized protein LOC123532137 [Mercenaria mercenaria]